MTPLAVLGTPLVFDRAIRPLVRGLQVTVGCFASAVVFWWLGPWWAPGPLTLSFLAYEAFFWSRGDRPIQLRLGEELHIHDEVGGRALNVHLSQVRAVTVYRRPHQENRDEVTIVLADATSVLFAATFHVEPDVPASPTDIPIPMIDAMLGGVAGILRTVSDPAVRCRQTIDDPRGTFLQALRQRLPEHVFERTVVRFWTGAEPPLDVFGHHHGSPDGVLMVDGDTWQLRTGTGANEEGVLAFARVQHALRTILLATRFENREDMRAADGLQTQELDLPLLVLAFEPTLHVAIPAPSMAPTGPGVTAHRTWRHTTAPEGGALLYHLMRRWPVTAWPHGLRGTVSRHMNLQQPSADRVVRTPPPVV